MNEQPDIDIHEEQNRFIYQMVDRTAMKIAVLIKIANLPYILKDLHIDNEIAHPYILQTPYGQLTKEYQIINYIINQSRQLAGKQEQKLQKQSSSEVEVNKDIDARVIDLTGQDLYITIKMHEKLYELRRQLFPLFHQFYKYLTGFQKTKKGKYDSLMNKIKKQIGDLDSFISQHPQLFEGQANFLTIIIACEMFMACKFVFQEKFRKSKYSLFNKFEKLSHKPEFKEIYGKSEFCSKEYIPTEFQEEEIKMKKQQTSPTDLIKIPQSPLSFYQIESNRNQLLYSYFRQIFNQQQTKRNHFPFFWLMYHDLNCSLFQIFITLPESSYEIGSHKLRLMEGILRKDLVTNLDYGFLGLYQQKDNSYFVRGIMCLGSKSFEEFEAVLFSSVQDIDFKLHKVDILNPTEKKEVEDLWEHLEQNTIRDEILLKMIIHV